MKSRGSYCTTIGNNSAKKGISALPNWHIASFPHYLIVSPYLCYTLGNVLCYEKR